MNKTAQQYKNPAKKELTEQKQKLVDAKRHWNGKYKEFQGNLKLFKNLLNGRIEGKERLKLYESLPEDSVSKIEELAKQFEHLATLSKHIVPAQSFYSKKYNDFYTELNAKRKENQIKQEGKKASVDKDYNLVSEGISPWTLKLKNLKNIFPWLDRKTKIQTQVLNNLFNLDQQYSQLEESILNVSKDSDFIPVRDAILRIMASTEANKKITEKYIESMSDVGEIERPKQDLTASYESIEHLKKVVRDTQEASLVLNNLDKKNIKINIDQKLIPNIQYLASNILAGVEPWSKESDVRDWYEKLCTDFINLAPNSININLNALPGRIMTGAFFKNVLKENPVGSYADDTNFIYDPIGKKIKKRFSRYFKSNVDIQDLFDYTRENRQILDSMMADIYQDIENLSNIFPQFATLNSNNKNIIERVKLVVPTSSMDEKAIEQAVKPTIKQRIKELFGAK